MNEALYFDAIAYTGTDDTTRAVIAHTLSKLPDGVASWALHHCLFVSVGGEIMGHTFSREALGNREHIVVLDEDAMQSMNGPYVVAHELAHARLKHPTFVSPDEGTEEAADALALGWGFRRR